jgi:hypothetical protein
VHGISTIKLQGKNSEKYGDERSNAVEKGNHHHKTAGKQ